MSENIFYWQHALWYEAFPYLLLCLLLIATHLIYLRYFKSFPPTLASGASIIAGAAFLVASYPVYHYALWFMMVLSCELLIICLYLEISLVDRFLHHDHFFIKSDELNLSLWSIANAMLAVLFIIDDKLYRGLHGFIIVLALLAGLMWVLYLILMLKHLKNNVANHLQRQSPGLFLLLPISALVLLLLNYDLFGDEISNQFYRLCLLSSMALYALSLILISVLSVLRKGTSPVTSLSIYSLIHGTISLFGVACLLLAVFTQAFVHMIWWLDIVTFVLVESMLILKTAARDIQYHPYQWLRCYAYINFVWFNALYLPHRLDQWGFALIALFIAVELIVLSRTLYQHHQKILNKS